MINLLSIPAALVEVVLNQILLLLFLPIARIVVVEVVALFLAEMVMYFSMTSIGKLFRNFFLLFFLPQVAPYDYETITGIVHF